MFAQNFIWLVLEIYLLGCYWFSWPFLVY